MYLKERITIEESNFSDILKKIEYDIPTEAIWNMMKYWKSFWNFVEESISDNTFTFYFFQWKTLNTLSLIRLRYSQQPTDICCTVMSQVWNVGDTSCITDPFLGNLLATSGFLLKGPSNVQLWCFLWCWSEKALEQTIRLLVIWDALLL